MAKLTKEEKLLELKKELALLDKKSYKIKEEIQNLEREIFIEKSKVVTKFKSKTTYDKDLDGFKSYLENEYVSTSTKKKLSSSSIDKYLRSQEKLDAKLKELGELALDKKIYLCEDISFMNYIYDLFTKNTSLHEFDLGTSNGSPRASVKAYIQYLIHKIGK